MLIAAIPLFYEKFVFVIRFLKDNIGNGRARRPENLACGKRLEMAIRRNNDWEFEGFRKSA
jgi:hypothetical protein